MLTLAAALVALMAGCGESPSGGAAEGVPPAAKAGDAGLAGDESAATSGPSDADRPWFEEAATSAGVDFVHDSGHQGPMLFPEIMSGGAALLDIDGDGDLDLYLVQAGPLDGPADARQPNRLFANQGDGTFVDVTESAGVGDRGYGIGAAAGDVDNDGDTDLYVTNLGPNVLYLNDGTGVFKDVTATAGVGGSAFSSSAGFLDFDRDGFLDLYVTNDIQWSMTIERDCFSNSGLKDYCGPNAYTAPEPDSLYRNNGDGTFEDVSESAGLHTHFGNGLGLVTLDADSDGWTDVFVANDGTPDQLWRNRGDGTFEDVAPRWGVAMDEGGVAKAGMGTTAADLDHDGAPEILVVNLASESDSLYTNAGSYFVDSTAQRGLADVTRSFTRFGVGFQDFNNDGWLDLYYANGRVRWHSERFIEDDVFAEPNILVRGTPGGVFEEVKPRGGTSQTLFATSRAAAFGDLDNDGGIDALIVNRDAGVHLLRNIIAGDGHWLGLEVLTADKRAAIGARVVVTARGAEITREVRTAYSYAASNDPRLHVGLGESDSVDSITVHWLDGLVERFPPLDPVDRYVTLVQGTGSTD